MLLDVKLPVYYIFKRILPDILRVMLISIIFQLLKYFFGHYLPLIPLQLATILGSSISLLLAFNVSQSYDRWWEGRKIWGAVVNDSRTLVLQVRSFLQPEALSAREASEHLTAVAYRQIAWCYSLGESLRGQDPMPSLAKFLSEPDLAYAQAQKNRPLALLALHSTQIRELHLKQAVNTFQQVQLDSTLVRLCETMGQAERIKSTVFPANYRLLVHFLIYLFLGTLSLSLVESMGFWEVPVLLLIATTFFLIERTARYLQDPFNNAPTDTPVTAISRNVEINLKQLLEEPNVPAPLTSDTFYLM
ncbi:bestrophin family protein [Hymenobacter yonginensis]|uniref:Bestrophin family ion channel n=1 Tax=Hymenobacter yonginensis TaxID=748197 RepID=A0ABY7PS88_9BACT|nr:bestrophin family ion channel [Hymenobacter yonginensis]WBO85698.1 bestrophin family ion channel [Hymenobacter yonginensis]